jgi:NADH-quinone oxidoreductase subunit H
MIETILLKALFALIVIAVLMGLCAYSVLAERKVSSWIQGRVGPNRASLPFVAAIPIVGPILRRLGIFQPIADGAKFLFKEEPVPGHVNTFYFFLAPILSIVPALLTVVVLPFGEYYTAAGDVCPIVLANLDIGILFVFAVSSLGVYGIIIAGWASNSKYPLYGSIRASAQMISYELAMALSVLPVFLWVNAPHSDAGLNLFSVVTAQEDMWFLFWQPVSALLFLVALFAETNRLPFDMPESETELVGGFHTEYGGFKFGLFFVAEYAHMIIGSAVFTILFLGGWNFLPGLGDLWPHNILGAILSVFWFMAKVALLLFLFLWVRWTLPRFRYDQVMNLGWSVLLPLAVANLVFYTLLIAFIERA